MMEGFQPWLMVSEYIATRKEDAERGPLVRINPVDARRRLLEDGELVWVYGPRRHELAVLPLAGADVQLCQRFATPANGAGLGTATLRMSASGASG